MKSIHSLMCLLAATVSCQAYWLMAIDDLVTTRLDPIVNPGNVSGHLHKVVGASNFGPTIPSSQHLRESKCTSVPIKEDFSNYWVPNFHFAWANGSFSTMRGGMVVYYLFSDKPGVTTPFPEDFRMLSGTPTLRSYNSSSYAQQAVSFLCLNYAAKTTTRYSEIPPVQCPDGIRSQINFPSCWDGKNADSPDHKSHVAFLSGGPDTGTCSDPAYPKTLPRIFIEVYWDTKPWYEHIDLAANKTQPFVLSTGDPTGAGYHGDFVNGWIPETLQKAVDECNCNPYGSFDCCVERGIFKKDDSHTCSISTGVDEKVEGTLEKLPGNNPMGYEPPAVGSADAASQPGLLPIEATYKPKAGRKRDGLVAHRRLTKKFGPGIV